MVQSTEWGIRLRLVVQDAPEGVPPILTVNWNGGATLVEPQAERQVQDTDSLPEPRYHPQWQLGRGPPAVVPGDVWQLTLRLKAVHGQHNPGGFDSELWAWEQGIGAVANVRTKATEPMPLHLARTWQRPLERLRQGLRDRLLAHFDHDAAPARWAGVLAALLIGDQAAIRQGDWDLFRITGVAHLVSISGLHITLFAWLAGRIIGRLWRRSARLCLRWPAPRVAACGGVVCATLYALLSGWGLPAQRTVGMMVGALALRESGLRWPWPRVWFAVMGVVVLFDPWALLSAGFWLSFVAVGVLVASSTTGPLESPNAIWPRVGQRMVLHLRASLREQWVITLALAPLTLLLFQQLSISGLLANLLAVPWVTLVITPLTLLGVVWPALWDVAHAAMQGLGVCLQAMAQWPLAVVTVAQAPLWLSILGLLGACVCVLPLPWALRSLGLPAVIMVFLWQAPRPPHGQFDVRFADIGQGNAVVVRTQHHTLVYDSGPRYGSEADAGHRILLPLLRTTAEAPDLLVVSHQDNDHSGGAAALLAAFPDMDYLSSLPPEHIAARQKLPTRCISASVGGQAWVWDGIGFEILHPQPQDYDKPQQRSNALSCVLRISNGAHTVLLVGDLEAEQEARLVQTQAPQLAANVLLVPHHGSKTSSSGGFLDAVHPQWAIVQAAYHNRYGHPAPRIMQRYAIRAIPVLESPHCGAASWQSVQPAQIQCSRITDRRYWHHEVP